MAERFLPSKTLDLVVRYICRGPGPDETAQCRAWPPNTAEVGPDCVRFAAPTLDTTTSALSGLQDPNCAQKQTATNGCFGVVQIYNLRET